MTLGLLGLVFFGSAFVAALGDPGFVEQVSRNIIRYEVERRTREKIDALDQRFLAGKAAVFARGHAEEMARTKQLLAEHLPERLAVVMAEMHDLDCECRRKIERNLRELMQGQITGASAARERLTMLIRTHYVETAAQLTREFRIFTGTNAAVFALLALAVAVRRRAGVHLLPAAAVLLAAAGFTAYLYLFGQDWLHTLVFHDYVGWAYLGYLGLAFAMLCDILFNRARVTTEVLNGMLNVVGSALSAVPC